MEQKKHYHDKLLVLKSNLNDLKKQQNSFILVRLLAFLVMVLPPVFIPGIYIYLLSVFGLILFIWGVSRSQDIRYQLTKNGILIHMYEFELGLLDGAWNQKDNGEIYKDHLHHYANDLDLFGDRSLYAFINRTATPMAGLKLANQLKNGVEDHTFNKEGILFLENHLEDCFDFVSDIKAQIKEGETFKQLNELPQVNYKASSWVQVIRIVFPLFFMISLANTFLNFLPYDLLTISILLNVILTGWRWKIHTTIFNDANFMTFKIKSMRKQLQFVDKWNDGTALKVFFDAFKMEEKNADEILKTGEKVLSKMDLRMNLIVGTVLNLSLLWDYQVANQFINWKNKYLDSLLLWEEKLTDIEIWISGAIFKYNLGETTFAAWNSDESIEIIGMNHPFVKREKRKANDFTLSNDEGIMIITGPNMAGKSTYLRAIGLTFVLSNMGFPVLAKKVTIPSMRLFSSMRTSDNVNDESSYFFAELSRLKSLMDILETKEKVFFLLDEILKGTNSKDKAEGSAKFLTKVMQYQAKGIIATHDLSLCELEREDKRFTNFYFDSTIIADELYFNYEINKGVCQNMNASFLMRKMGLIDVKD